MSVLPTEKEAVDIISGRIRKLEKTQVMTGGPAGKKQNEERGKEAKNLRNVLRGLGTANKPR